MLLNKIPNALVRFASSADEETETRESNWCYTGFPNVTQPVLYHHYHHHHPSSVCILPAAYAFSHQNLTMTKSMDTIISSTLLMRELSSSIDIWSLDRRLVALRIAKGIGGTNIVSAFTMAWALSYSHHLILVIPYFSSITSTLGNGNFKEPWIPLFSA